MLFNAQTNCRTQTGNPRTLGIVAATALTAMLLLASTGNAGIIPHLNRAAWEAAVGGATGTEDFEGFAADTSFNGVAVALADGMNIGTQVATPGDNLIDVVPLVSNVNDVNGTNSARMLSAYLGSAGGADILSRPFVSFDGPVSGFGADFVNFNDGALETEVEVFVDDGLAAVFPLPILAFGAAQFWGIEATAGEMITEVRFIRMADDLFGMDNLAIAAAASGRGLTGDHNGDGVVDAADYVALRDSSINRKTYKQWRANFGAVGGHRSASSAVPEPSTLALCSLVCLGLYALVRIREER